MNLKTLKSVKEMDYVAGKKVLVRVDFNVPVENGKILDDFRIKKALPTIELLKKKGAKIILLSHMSGNDVNSLEPIARHMRASLNLDVKFVEEYFSDNTNMCLSKMKDGDIVLFENLRARPEEKTNDEKFAEKLAFMADFYVNEAFASSHREHASIVGLPKMLPSYAGELFIEEVKNLSIILDPPRPFLFILGGAKFDTKIPLAKQFTATADYLVLGGAISNQIFKAKGWEIGRSLVSEEDYDIDEEIEKMILPEDVKVERGDTLKVIKPNKIKKGDRVVDIGPDTIAMIREFANQSKCILWNGPVGEYKEGYKETSLEVARAVSESGAVTITGGGDTLSAISEIKVEEKFTFVSTAGGAMLDFLAHGTLPGIEALKEHQSS